jgi:hypothetical protein
MEVSGCRTGTSGQIGTLTVSIVERKRLGVLLQVRDGMVTVAAAGRLVRR